MTPLRNKMNNVLASRGTLQSVNVGNRSKPCLPAGRLADIIYFESEVL